MTSLDNYKNTDAYHKLKQVPSVMACSLLQSKTSSPLPAKFWGDDFPQNSLTACSFEIKEKQIETILKPSSDMREEFLLKNIERRIANCRKGVFRKAKCPKCGEVLGSEKGEHAVRITCDNKFCSFEFCITSRKIKAKKNLKAYNIKAEELIHLIIGFEIQTGESKEKKQRREKVLKAMMEKLNAIIKYSSGQELHAVMTWDITDKTLAGHENLGKRFFIHVHLAVLPVNFSVLMFAVREVQENYKGIATIRNKGFKPRKSLFRYFGKILAGEVSGEGKHHTLHYNQFLILAEYVEFFYRKKMLRAFACSLNSLAPVSRDMFHQIGLSLPEKCPACNSEKTKEKFWIIFYEIAEAVPPPDAKKYLIKQVYITEKCFTEVKTPF